jgi:chromosome segregation ATPase
LSAVEEDKDWLQFKELESELISLEAELKTLESEVSKLFAPIRKALNLIKKLDETGRCTLSHKERGMLSSIQASPIQVLDEDISGFLNVIKGIIEGDSAILKDKKREKTLKSIDNLLDAELSVIKERRNLLQREIEARGSELSNLRILDRRYEIEASIASDKGELTRLGDEMERSGRHLISLEAEIKAKEKDLSEALRGIVDYEVVVTDLP